MGSFLAPETDMIFGDGVGASLVFQLFSTALGWSAWRAFLPDRFANHKLLITRAIRLLTAATIRPAHARPPHPTWVTAVRQIFRCYHPQGKLLFLRACFPQYVMVPFPDGIRDVDVLGFSAGSYTGLTTKAAAIASPPEMLRLATGDHEGWCSCIVSRTDSARGAQTLSQT